MHTLLIVSLGKTLAYLYDDSSQGDWFLVGEDAEFNMLAVLSYKMFLLTEMYFNIINLSNEELELIFRGSAYAYIHRRYW